MRTARVLPMPGSELTEWRAARAASGVPLPEATGGEEHGAVTLEVDGVAVGGALLAYGGIGTETTCSVRVLQTTLARDDDASWTAVIAALETHVRRRGGLTTLAAAIAPELAAVFGASGFQATMATLTKRLDPGADPELQEDRRVAVRPMSREERVRFVVEVREFLRSGMERAGVIDPASARMDEMEGRLTHLTDDPPPPQELLMTGLVDDVPVGRAWATTVERDGALDFYGNTIDLFPEHRGQGLTKSFVGALVRHVRTLGVRDVRLRVYGYDTPARDTLLEEGAGITEVHVRKEL